MESSMPQALLPADPCGSPHFLPCTACQHVHMSANPCQRVVSDFPWIPFPSTFPCMPFFQKRMNLTKTVRKAPITMDMQRVGPTTEDSKRAPHKYDEADRFVSAAPGVQGLVEGQAVGAGACSAKGC